MAWAMQTLGAEDTEDAYRARANAVVDAIAGRTPEAAVIATAEQAALT